MVQRVEEALSRLERALAGLDNAVASVEGERIRARDQAGELSHLHADRARLAEALDTQTAESRKLDDASREVARRLVTAMDEIRMVLEEDAAS